MTDVKRNMGTGSRELEEREERRLEEREELGLEPEKKPGPRVNDGISSAGRLYTSQEEADEASESGNQRREDVDREAAGLHGDEPQRE